MNNRFFTWIKRNLGCILGFLVPFIILGGIFIGRQIIPWGDNMYLRSDMYHQYAPFYKELYNKLTSGGSFEFSWNIGMGVNFTAIYAYYLASPINLLLGLLPEGILIHAMDFLIILKTALAGFTCAIFLSKHFKTKSAAVGAVSVFYALSSYMAAFSWNIMWLDCIILLPLVVLGLESLVKEGRYKLYTISLGLAIFTNYYIAIMICIFAVLYFLYLLFCTMEDHSWGYRLKKFLSFGLFSLLAGGIGAIMFIPELYALGYTVSGNFSFPELWSNYFSILDMLSRSLISVPVAIFSAHDPNLYCTVGVFLMVPLYCMCSSVPIRERIGKIALVSLMLLSFNMNIPNYIWHGFHFPNSLPARESFIYIFLLIMIGYEACCHIKDFSKKQLFGVFAGAIALLLLIEELYVGDEYSFDIVYVSIIFLCFYMVLILLYANDRLKKNFIVYLLFVVCIAEATINSDHEDSYKTTSYSAYITDNAAIEELVDDVAKKDTDFYRIEKLTRRTKNDAAWNNYHGVSIFSSMTNGSVTDFLGALGFEKSTNAYSYYGSTPFTSALLSVKYVLSNKFMSNDDWYTLYNFKESESRYLYQVNYCLPVGFMLPDNFDEDWKMTGNNPFALQNSFAELATGFIDMFTYIPATSTGTTSEFTLEKDSDVYVYVTTYVDQISYNAKSDENTYISSDTFSGLEHRQICHFGEFPAGTTITVTTSDADATSLQLYAYSFNKNVFDNVYNYLNRSSFNVSEFTDTSITGTVNVAEAGDLYLSVVYDKGWSAYVDGKEVSISSLKGAFITVPVPAGTHKIELKYNSDGLFLGMVLSGLSILILILIILFERGLAKLFGISLADRTRVQEEHINKPKKEKSKKENKTAKKETITAPEEKPVIHNTVVTDDSEADEDEDVLYIVDDSEDDVD